MNKILVIYHRVDFDGIFSCCIVKDFFLQDNPNNFIKTFGWNYTDPIPDFNMITRGFNTVIIVDVSFPKEFMLQLLNSCINKVWIDHHITAINDSISNGYDKLPGLRGIDYSASEYCWKFFNNTTDIPELITYVGMYDRWYKSGNNWDDVIAPAQLGLKNRFGVSERVIWDNWRDIVESDQDLIEEILYDGSVIYNYMRNQWKSHIKNFAFPVRVAGKYNAICLLSTEFGSSQFQSVIDDFDIYIVINRRDKNLYSISMYKETDRIPEFSCGGYKNIRGHKSAGGGVLSLEEFENLIETCEF